MVNDTSTLNGSLLEMKDQLIYELGEQGVTATYDPTTGLLGLIHKISEITPVVQTLTLISNKSILSAYHNETSTLTATHSGGSGKTVEIYNAVTGTKIGDATDNNDGTYTYTYSATGIGDISMTATSGTLESNAITIEDCKWYDEAVTGNTHSTDYSNFGSAPTLTVEADGMKVSTTSGERFAVIPIEIPSNTDFEISYTYNGGNETSNCLEISSGTGNQRHLLTCTALYETPDRWLYGLNGTLNNRFYDANITVGDKIKLKRVNGAYTYYLNDNPLFAGVTQTSSGYVTFETYQDGRYTVYKDIKLKISQS